jgi:hypothetical protein
VFDYGFWYCDLVRNNVFNKNPKVSHHCLHCPIAPTPLISGIVVISSANAQKMWIFLYYYLQQILSW